jgi:L-aspartate oxidase
MTRYVDTDVLVLGAGAAGAATAVTAAAAGRRVIVALKGHLGDGSTAWAQGGLAAVLDPRDSPAAHVADTLAAGAGLCDELAVRALVAGAPAAIGWLRRLGARFDAPDGTPAGPNGVLALTREGGHRYDRVVHAGGDASGAEVSRVLARALRADPRVTILERHVGLDLLVDSDGQVVGGRLGRLGRRADAGRDADTIDEVVEVHARAVVLATGGLGQAYAATTNPPGATGDGIALALRAGATVSDIEFVQFHPTVLWRGPGATGQQVLISEAMRGEGAVLVDATGRRVMLGRHPMADLAPRDVVSAAMHAHMASAPGGVGDHLWLDATVLGRATLERRFPTILAACRAAGIDPVTEPIPVAPGAHYSCGGVRAGLDGRTDVPGLFAVGEVARTGVHGANRLASNSLTESLVAGRLTGDLLGAWLPEPGGEPVPTPPLPRVDPRTRAGTAEAMSRWAGVVRDGTGLTRLLAALARAGVHRSVPGEPPRDLASIEAAHLHLVATAIATAALTREESRGCHRRADADGPREAWETQVEVRLVDGRIEATRERAVVAA